MWNLQHLALDLQGCLHGGKEGVQDWWIRAGPSGHLHAKSLAIVISNEPVLMPAGLSDKEGSPPCHESLEL